MRLGLVPPPRDKEGGRRTGGAIGGNQLPGSEGAVVRPEVPPEGRQGRQGRQRQGSEGGRSRSASGQHRPARLGRRRRSASPVRAAPQDPAVSAASVTPMAEASSASCIVSRHALAEQVSDEGIATEYGQDDIEPGWLARVTPVQRIAIQGVDVRLTSKFWDGTDGSVYVGSGDAATGLPCSLWALPGYVLTEHDRRALIGRELVIDTVADLEHVRQLVEQLRLHDFHVKRTSHRWREEFRTLLKKPGLSVSRVGLTVKELLFAFPGHLGVFLSVFPVGTARALAGCPELS